MSAVRLGFVGPLWYSSTKKDNNKQGEAMNAINTDIKCDYCPARAVKRIEFPTGHDLIFCSHHTVKYMAQIQATVLVTDLEPTEVPVPVG